MVIHPTITCHSVPNLGPLLGNRGSSVLLEELNHRLAINGGGTIFAQNSSSTLQERMQMFLTNVIEPEVQSTEHFMDVIGNTFVDAIRDIVSVEDLEQGIPLSMHEAIVSFEPVRKLIEAGEIYGFGYQTKELPSEDRIGRLIKNGVVNLSDPVPPEGLFMEMEWDLDDPDITLDELDSLERTRNWIQEFLVQTEFDPTSYPDKRGSLRD